MSILAVRRDHRIVRGFVRNGLGGSSRRKAAADLQDGEFHARKAGVGDDHRLRRGAVIVERLGQGRGECLYRGRSELKVLRVRRRHALRLGAKVPVRGGDVIDGRDEGHGIVAVGVGPDDRGN